MILIDIPNNLSPLEWFMKWLPSIGWPAILLVSWKIHTFFAKMEKKAADVMSLVENTDKLTTAISTEVKTFKTSLEEHIKEDDEHFKALRESLSLHIQTSAGVVAGIEKLAEAIHHQSDIHASQFEILRGINEKQAILATNQTNITSGFQRVVEQLISMMKD